MKGFPGRNQYKVGSSTFSLTWYCRMILEFSGSHTTVSQLHLSVFVLATWWLRGRGLWSGGWRTIITSMLHHGVAKPLSLPRTYLKVVTAAVASVSVVGGGCHDKKNAVCVVEPGWANTGAEEKVPFGGRRIDGVIRLECAKLNMVWYPSVLEVVFSSTCRNPHHDLHIFRKLFIQECCSLSLWVERVIVIHYINQDCWNNHVFRGLRPFGFKYVVIVQQTEWVLWINYLFVQSNVLFRKM